MTRRSFAPFASASLFAMLAVPALAAAAGPAVTVYTRDLGFVRETRTLEIGGARDTVRITDVPERIDFSSVAVDLGGARITRLAYRYDVATGDGMIDRARGGRVRVNLRGDRVVEGALLATDGAWIVVREDNGSVHTLARASIDDVRIAEPAVGFSTRPTLEIAVDGAKRGRVEARLSYLTGGMSWAAEHTVVRRNERQVSWSADVTVENQTGRDFVDADLKLVAGEPHRDGGMPPPMPMRTAMAFEAKASDGAGVDLSEQAFSEYHLYTLGRAATLRDKENQKFSMLDPRNVAVAPRYLYRGGDPGGVRSQILVENTTAAGLGVPLPAGRVRFYEADASGDLQFTGEAHIKHTAEGEKLTLDVGYVFDLAAERRELYNKRITDREREYQVEIKLRNRKKTDVTITAQESIGGDIEITQKTHDFVRKDANTIEFTVAVPAGKEVTVQYTARVRY